MMTERSQSGSQHKKQNNSSSIPPDETDHSENSNTWKDPGDQTEENGTLQTVVEVSVAAALLILVLGLVGYYSRGLLSSMNLNQVMKQANLSIDTSPLPKRKKMKLRNRFKKIKRQYQNEKITYNQVREMLQHLQRLLMAAQVQSLKRTHIASSDWTNAEKSDAARTLDRLSLGLIEQKIDRKAYLHILQPIRTSANQAERFLKKSPSKNELNVFIQNANEQLQKRNVPDEPYDFDVISEFDRTAREVLENTVSSNH